MENLITLVGMVGVVTGGLWFQHRHGRASSTSRTAHCDICGVAVAAALLSPFETPAGEAVALCRDCHPAYGHAAPGVSVLAAV